jgi:hypothetical protein
MTLRKWFAFAVSHEHSHAEQLPAWRARTWGAVPLGTRVPTPGG